MQFALKVLISLAIIILCGYISKVRPSASGLISVMPLTGLLALIWVYLGNPNDKENVLIHTKSAIWGILPSILFFVIVLFCLYKKLNFWMAVSIGIAAWLAGAFVHQLLVK